MLGASLITSRLDPAGEGWLPKDLNHVSSWLGWLQRNGVGVCLAGWLAGCLACLLAKGMGY